MGDDRYSAFDVRIADGGGWECGRYNDGEWACGLACRLTTHATCRNTVEKQNAVTGDETIRRHGVHAEI